MGFWKCVSYLVTTAVLGFVGGRLLPPKWLNPNGWLFRTRAFEEGGRIYEKLGIRKWQKKVPDMSRIFPKWMPAKNLSGNYKERLPVMIRETCTAEVVHLAVGLTGLRCFWLWPGVGGLVIVLIHGVLLNLPFILIQRYNRPRLMKLLQRIETGRSMHTL